MLTERYKTARVKCCAERIRPSDDNWAKTIFERKQFYSGWTRWIPNLLARVEDRKPFFFYLSQSDGGLVMVWGPFGGAKISMLAILERDSKQPST